MPTIETFDTRDLIAVVPSLIRPASFLINRFFPGIALSPTEVIDFDVIIKKRRVAPFVSPLVAGRVRTQDGYVAKQFKPAYVKPKDRVDPARMLKRRAGERVGGSQSPEQRMNATVVDLLQDQFDTVQRRLELMAAETLRTGKVTIAGEDYPTQVVDFGRTAGHTITLTGANRWGQAGIKPLDDLESWALTMAQNSGATVTDVVFDIEAWKLFRVDADVKAVLDTRRGSEARVETAPEVKPGPVFKGSIGSFNLWTYTDWYEDPDNPGTELPFLPANTVILGSSQMEGIRAFGAIQDVDVLQAMEFYPKTWVEQDPSARFIMGQSAPLVVPTRVDASFSATIN